MDLYIVSGPLHLFNSICLLLQENRGSNACICIINCFNGADKLCERVIDSKIFTYVWLFDEYEIYKYSPESNNDILHRLRRRTKIGRNKNYSDIYSDFPLLNMKFTHIYVPGDIPPLREYIEYQKRVNNAKISLIDDGLGHRIGRKNPCLIDKLKKFFLGYRTIHDLADKIYFFSPELTVSMYPFTMRVAQKKPPCISENPEFYEKIGKIFFSNEDIMKYEINKINNIKYLFLSSGFDVGGNIEYAQKEKSIITLCNKYMKPFFIKTHPASKIQYDDFCVYDTCIPLEVLFLYANLENMLLISPISAALFNPKFIFDKEPYVALIYKLIGISNIAEKMFFTTEKEFEKRINLSLKNAYHDKEKVCIPETIDELIYFIECYKRKQVKIS